MPASLIFIGLIFSTVSNNSLYAGLGAIKGWFLFPLIFAIIFFDQIKKDDELIWKSWNALFYSGVVVSIVGVVYGILGNVTYDGRLRIFWDSPNQLAMFLAVPFLIGIHKVRPWGIPQREVGEGKGRTLEINWKSLLIIGGIILVAFNLYLTQSYGAWLGIAVALAVLFLLGYRERIQKKYFVSIITILIVLVAWAGINKYKSIADLDGRSSFSSRVMIWRSAGLMIAKNPALGIGPGNFQEKYLEYQKYFPPYLEWSAPQPHNIFLAFWLESGLLGLIGFIWILILFFRDNKKVYPPAKIQEYNTPPIHGIKKQASDKLACGEDFGGRATQKNRELGFVFFAIMIYILIHGLVDTTYWRNDLAVVFWVVVAMNFYLAQKNHIG